MRVERDDRRARRRGAPPRGRGAEQVALTEVESVEDADDDEHRARAGTQGVDALRRRAWPRQATGDRGRGRARRGPCPGASRPPSARARSRPACPSASRSADRRPVPAGRATGGRTGRGSDRGDLVVGELRPPGSASSPASIGQQQRASRRGPSAAARADVVERDGRRRARTARSRSASARRGTPRCRRASPRSRASARMYVPAEQRDVEGRDRAVRIASRPTRRARARRS